LKSGVPKYWGKYRVEKIYCQGGELLGKSAKPQSTQRSRNNRKIPRLAGVGREKARIN